MDDQAIETETAAPDALGDVISEIQGEWEAAGEGDTEGQETAAAEIAQNDTGEQIDTAPAAEEPEADHATERLVAREVELRTRETALQAEKAQIDAIRAENESLKAQVAKISSEFVDDMRHRPFEALEAAGHDPEHTLRLLLAKKFEKDGKPVPAALRDEIREAQYEYKFKQQELKLQQIEQQRAQMAFVAKVESDAREYVSTKLGTSKDAPLVAKAAKTNPDRVYREIMDEVANEARAAAGKNPNAALLTFDEAARRVEKRWSEMAAMFGAPAASTTTNAPTTQGAGQSVVNNKNPKPAVPPSKPMMKSPAKSEADLLNEAIELGTQEFRRQETARKAPARQ